MQIIKVAIRKLVSHLILRQRVVKQCLLKAALVVTQKLMEVHFGVVAATTATSLTAGLLSS